MKWTTRKIGSQERGFLKFLRSLIMTAGSLLIKNALTSLKAASSSADAAIKNIYFWSGTTTPVIPNKEMDDITRIVKSFEETGLLI